MEMKRATHRPELLTLMGDRLMNDPALRHRFEQMLIQTRQAVDNITLAVEQLAAIRVEAEELQRRAVDRLIDDIASRGIPGPYVIQLFPGPGDEAPMPDAQENNRIFDGPPMEHEDDFSINLNQGVIFQDGHSDRNDNFNIVEVTPIRNNPNSRPNPHYMSAPAFVRNSIMGDSEPRLRNDPNLMAWNLSYRHYSQNFPSPQDPPIRRQSQNDLVVQNIGSLYSHNPQQGSHNMASQTSQHFNPDWNQPFW
jgi:hypothetical protein